MLFSFGMCHTMLKVCKVAPVLRQKGRIRVGKSWGSNGSGGLEQIGSLKAVISVGAGGHGPPNIFKFPFYFSV